MIQKVIATAVAGWLFSVVLVSSGGTPAIQAQTAQGSGVLSATPSPLFDTAHNCMACHNSLSTSAGEDISIGTAWRASMMAYSARDPYWHAAGRREVIDHPTAAADIEDECSICHMPMARTLSMSLGEKGRIFAHLPIASVTSITGRPPLVNQRTHHGGR